MGIASTVLSDGHLRAFGQDGYLVVPGVVPDDLLRALDDETDALAAAEPPPTGIVGKHFWFLAPTRLAAADAALRPISGSSSRSVAVPC